MIDLRSDTVTVPCEAMRAAIASAPVGDDVIDIDPTVAKLQETIAEMLGKEIAMFMPSGTMTNQAALRLHCRPGDEFICESGCHIYNYEQGAFAQLSGLACQTIKGDNSVLTVEKIRNLVRPFNEHAAQTKLLCLENTHNKGGGVVQPFDEVVAACDWAHENGLATHLDGARLFNAVVASGKSAKQWSDPFDTVSVCFSKGLGAPVGSALAGPKSMFDDMRRHRKVLGGGMRQSGIIAAGALYAIENNIERLADDHDSAQSFAKIVTQGEGLTVNPVDVHSNIVIFKVDNSIMSAPEFVEASHKAGVWMYPFSHEHVRAVTHMHISAEEAKKAGEIVCEVAGKNRS